MSNDKGCQEVIATRNFNNVCQAIEIVIVDKFDIKFKNDDFDDKNNSYWYESGTNANVDKVDYTVFDNDNQEQLTIVIKRK